jgi:hypothetical protein
MLVLNDTSAISDKSRKSKRFLPVELIPHILNHFFSPSLVPEVTHEQMFTDYARRCRQRTTSRLHSLITVNKTWNSYASSLMYSNPSLFDDSRASLLIRTLKTSKYQTYGKLVKRLIIEDLTEVTLCNDSALSCRCLNAVRKWIHCR